MHESTHPLRLWRLGQGLTQTDLAESLEVSPGFISMVELDYKRPSLALAAKISELTGLRIEVFVRGLAP